MSDKVDGQAYMDGLVGHVDTRTPEEFWGEYVTRAIDRLNRTGYKSSSRMMQRGDYDIIVEVRKEARPEIEYGQEVLTPVVARGLMWRLPRLVWGVFWDSLELLRRRRKMRAMQGIGHADDEGVTRLSISINLFREQDDFAKTEIDRKMAAHEERWKNTK